MDIRKIIYVIRAIGLSGIGRTIQNGLLRDRIEKQYSAKILSPTNLLPGYISETDTVEGGIRVKYENASLELVFLTQNLVKISWTPGKPPVPYTLAKTDWEIPNIIINRTSSGRSLRSGSVELIIDNTGGMLFRDMDGNTIRQDNPPILVGEGWRLSTLLAPDEHLYGLGERASSINLRPGMYVSWNTDPAGNYSRGNDPLYIGTPIYLSLSEIGSYLTYFENSYRSTFNISDTFDTIFSGGMLRYYLIFGSLETIYSQLAELLGRPPIPPRWALGYHQSRWGYRSESDILEVVKGFEENNLPLSAIHLDIDYMDHFRVFTINQTRFPDMKRLSNDLEEKNIKLVASLNPAVKRDPHYKVYQDGLSRDAFCKLPSGKVSHGVSWSGWSAFPDFSNSDTRKWWQEQYQALLTEGISGLWHDMNEPSSFAGWGDKTLPISTAHSMEGHGGDHLEAHNLYGLLMNQAGYEGLKIFSPSKRPWILSRSGWAGLQRYAWTWTGDVESSWEALRQTIPTILGLGLSGHAFSGVDIGGFSSSPSAELYLRWFQMAAFLPFFRTHSAIGTKPREPWVFGEPITSIVRNFLKLRYKLIPYLYTLAWETSETGYPPIRPIYWANPHDKKYWDIEDEFLMGDGLLIAPILNEKAPSRTIVLPPGIWYSYWNDSQYIGPTEVELPTTLENIPVFIKGGTILPTDEDHIIHLHVYPNNSGRSINHLYNDSGDGYGAWRLDTFQMSNELTSLNILWDSVGDYPFPVSSIILHVHGKSVIKAVIDGSFYPIQSNLVVTSKFQSLQIEYG